MSPHAEFENSSTFLVRHSSTIMPKKAPLESTVDVESASPGGVDSFLLDKSHHVRREKSILPTHHGSENKRMLGIDVGHLSPGVQFALIAGGAIFFNLFYGSLQEYLVTYVFRRRLGLFMSLLQTSSFAALAWGQRKQMGGAKRRVPLLWYLGLAFCQAMSMGLGNMGVMRLNYASKVLFKSSKAVPMMIWGSLFLNKHYSRREYTCVAILAAGLVMFLEADANSSPVFSIAGVVLMVACVFMDCCYSNMCERMFNLFHAHPEETLFYTYAGGAFFHLGSTLFSGELVEGTRFVLEGGWRRAPAFFAYALTGYLGASCAANLTKHYGALTSTLTSATRKALGLVFSFAMFPKPFTLLHGVGSTLFFSSLVTLSYVKADKKRRRSEVGSPLPTAPWQRTLNGSTHTHIHNRMENGRIDTARLEKGWSDKSDYNSTAAGAVFAGAVEPIGTNTAPSSWSWGDNNVVDTGQNAITSGANASTSSNRRSSESYSYKSPTVSIQQPRRAVSPVANILLGAKHIAHQFMHRRVKSKGQDDITEEDPLCCL